MVTLNGTYSRQDFKKKNLNKKIDVGIYSFGHFSFIPADKFLRNDSNKKKRKGKVICRKLMLI